MEIGSPYLRPCASHHNANAPLRIASSKSDWLTLVWSSWVVAGRVTIRRGNMTVEDPAHRAFAPARIESFPAPLGPTTSTSRPGPIGSAFDVAAAGNALMPPACRGTRRRVRQHRHHQHEHE